MVIQTYNYRFTLLRNPTVEEMEQSDSSMISKTGWWELI